MAMTRFLVLALLWTAAAWAPAAPQAAPARALATSELTIVSGEARHQFRVELALTPEDQAKGLMFRRELAADAGMLFVFPSIGEVSFWMRNTYIPLDLLFIDGDGRIVNITERAVPRSLATMPSGAPVRAVLEVNGGTVARLGIAPGDMVLHPMLNGER